MTKRMRQISWEESGFDKLTPEQHVQIITNNSVFGKLIDCESDIKKEAMTHLADLPRAITPARPFVKWVGGKRQLMPKILDAMPCCFNSYYEPFVGGGAVFWNIAHQRRMAYLSDANAELITTYQVVRDSVEILISVLNQYPYNEKFFYEMRAREIHSEDVVETAARFLYLNRTCFNGLYRVNSKGGFNTPFGRYTNPKICDPDNLRTCSRALEKTNLHCCGYRDTIDKMVIGDFAYFDPPYATVSKTSNFTSYTSSKFGDDEQVQLAADARALKARGVRVLLSNADTPWVRDLYHDFELISVQARRAVNSNAAKRGKVGELLIR